MTGSMTTTTLFKRHLVDRSRLEDLDVSNLPFGRVFSDHMFTMEYADGEWKTGEILPFQNLQMSPATMVLHYGQAIFEGMKAFRSREGDILMFRPEDNIKRFNISAERMCMPAVDADLFMEALHQLIDADRNWVPADVNSALYIRPFMIATDEFVGVKPSTRYTFMIFTCPVGAYYSGAVRVKVEREYTRAVPGGTGFVKAAGNYAASLKPTAQAMKEGYQQILWTDALEHKYIEESGTMNAVFVIDGKVTTPDLGDTILRGITRDSIIKLAQHMGLEVEERRISIDELIEGVKSGRVSEAFGVGTAATMTPIAAIGCDGEDVEFAPVDQWTVFPLLARALDDLRRGNGEDPFAWRVPV
jgi:branched-chain amino acid aminotransferase